MSAAQPIKLSKEIAIGILKTHIEVAQEKGAFTLRDAFLIHPALQHLDKDTKEKPAIFKDDPTPEKTALRYILNAIHAAQAKGSYSLGDAAVLFQVCSYVEQQHLTAAA